MRIPRYTIRRCQVNQDKRFGVFHASDFGYNILCCESELLDGKHWWIETNDFDGVVTCKKCLQILSQNLD